MWQHHDGSALLWCSQLTVNDTYILNLPFGVIQISCPIENTAFSCSKIESKGISRFRSTVIQGTNTNTVQYTHTQMINQFMLWTLNGWSVWQSRHREVCLIKTCHIWWSTNKTATQQCIQYGIDLQSSYKDAVCHNNKARKAVCRRTSKLWPPD